MKVIHDAYEDWMLLDAIHLIFEKSLPPVDSTHERLKSNKGSNVSLHTRGDIPLDRLQLDLVVPNKYIAKRAFRRFKAALSKLLEVFECFVDQVWAEPLPTRQQSGLEEAGDLLQIKPDSAYSKLASLKDAFKAEGLAYRLPSSADCEDNPMARISSTVSLRRELERKIKSEEFDPEHYRNAYEAIFEFNSVVRDLFQSPWQETASMGVSSILSDEELSVIQAVDHCSSSLNSLFTLLVRNMPCGASHSAWVHLSGFPQQGLNIAIATCQDTGADKIHMTTCRSFRETPQNVEKLGIGIPCQWNAMDDPQRHIYIAFCDNDLWLDTQPTVPQKYDIPTEDIDFSLQKLVARGGVDNSIDNYDFEIVDKKAVQLLLAYSLLCLCGTFWFQSCIGMDNVYSFPSPNSDHLIDRWRPHLKCLLYQNPSLELEISDQVYAFGIFLMEMESGHKASELPIEPDYENPETTTKDAILDATLAEWDRNVHNGYLQVARACLSFKYRVETVSSSLGENAKLKSAATIYKHIVLPLQRLLSDHHPPIAQLFTDFSSSVQSYANVELDFFDDVDITEKPPKPTVPETDKSAKNDLAYANEFINGLEASITEIKDLSKSVPGRKVKIAILDTGIDETDFNIRNYCQKRRIVEIQGFVNGDSSDIRDEDGHGSHVALILLKHAPAAEFYIAKISRTTKIPAKEVPRVHEGIEWALEKGVDIVSMSFGLRKRIWNIGKALRGAKPNQVMFAAASNGGIRGDGRPTYPAIQKRVFCIYACDGYGNGAKFNPGKLKGSFNFMTVGISIPTRLNKVDYLKSGTSFATPMAVAMVANCLEFTRHIGDLSQEEREFFFTEDGVQKIMKHMSLEENGYHFVDASRIWDKLKGRDRIANEFRDLVRQL